MSSEQQGLYREAFERDSCGFGLIANLDDQASHWLVKTAIASLGRLTHRGAVAADGKTRTVTSSGTDPKGKKFTTIAVYDKQ